MKLFVDNYLSAIVGGHSISLARLEPHDAAQFQHLQRSAVDGKATIRMIDMQLSMKRVVIEMRVVLELEEPMTVHQALTDKSAWDAFAPNPNAVDDDGLPQGFRK